VSHQKIPNLRNHLVAIYTFQEVFQFLLVWSAVTHPPSSISQISTIAEFLFTSLLFASAITSQINGDRLLEMEGGLEPSGESLSSLLSKATFSWVNALIWRGYQKPLSLHNLWDIDPADKASAILKDY
jgi:hypothetical protein